MPVVPVGLQRCEQPPLANVQHIEQPSVLVPRRRWPTRRRRLSSETGAAMGCHRCAYGAGPGSIHPGMVPRSSPDAAAALTLVEMEPPTRGRSAGQGQRRGVDLTEGVHHDVGVDGADRRWTTAQRRLQVLEQDVLRLAVEADRLVAARRGVALLDQLVERRAAVSRRRSPAGGCACSSTAARVLCGLGWSMTQAMGNGPPAGPPDRGSRLRSGEIGPRRDVLDAEARGD